MVVSEAVCLSNSPLLERSDNLSNKILMFGSGLTLTRQSQDLTSLEKKPIENSLGREENAGNRLKFCRLVQT